MTYEEWEKAFVDGGDKGNLNTRKMARMFESESKLTYRNESGAWPTTGIRISKEQLEKLKEYAFAK